MSHETNRPFDEFDDNDDENPFEDAGEWQGDDPFEDSELPLPFAHFEEPRGDDGATIFDLDEDEPLSDDDDFAQSLDGDPFDDDDPFEIPLDIAPGGNARCPGCGTTWDKIRQDGRTGCAACYGEFREQLSGVMARVQRGENHTGKTPRTLEKRHHRLQHLRKRRDNQLVVLQARLQHAIKSEKYEEAARLRDKIKIVTSTISDFG